MKDYYRILAVPGNATQADIRKAYYKLAKQYHPDTNHEPAQHPKFLEINEAYQILGDKSKREIYHYRWVNFHNPPKAKPSASQPFTQTHSQQKSTYQKPQTPPPYFRQRYQNYARPTYQEYEPFMRRVCQIVLLVSFLIMADKFLAHKLANEVITQIELPSEVRREASVYLTTTNTRFHINLNDFLDLAPVVGETITVWRTPFFNQITEIYLQHEEYAVNKGTLYHNFFGLVLLQMVAAAAGLNKRLRWQARLNAGIIAGCFGLIAFILLCLGF